ncbi:MAG: hypothetical protein K5641_05255 [Lachnospiraceae bacterium]|nr:hypothetical protein [Lachnospiraceae bacterium]
MKKKLLATLLTCSLVVTGLTACGDAAQGGGVAAPADAKADAPAAVGEEAADVPEEELEGIDLIIKEAEGMTMEELAKKAIEESNGKTFYGVGNSSRGKSALPTFIEYLQSIDSNYTMEFEWQQPKNNKIFEQLTSDSLKSEGTFAMTLIQDGNQIQSKMVDTGILKTFIPKEWAEANGTSADDFEGFLPLQTLNKVFMYNSTGDAKFTNCWDFVYEGSHPLFMGVDSEIVGKNFLMMLTEDKYAGWLKDAYDKLDATKKAYFEPTIQAMQADAQDLGLGANGAYALAWIKLWVNSYNEQTDDGPICNTLVDASAKDQSGLLVYSKLRSVEESKSVSVNNIKVAAYEDGYTGIGGYGYCHYLFLTKNSPLPWTACAFIAYMTNTAEGFDAWGKDMGGYSANPTVAKAIEEKYHHSQGGAGEFPAKDDRGYDWWTAEGKGELVLEDPIYCADVSFTVGSWIDVLDHYTPE